MRPTGRKSENTTDRTYIIIKIIYTVRVKSYRPLNDPKTLLYSSVYLYTGI